MWFRLQVRAHRGPWGWRTLMQFNSSKLSKLLFGDGNKHAGQDGRKDKEPDREPAPGAQDVHRNPTGSQSVGPDRGVRVEGSRDDPGKEAAHAWDPLRETCDDCNHIFQAGDDLEVKPGEQLFIAVNPKGKGERGG